MKNQEKLILLLIVDEDFHKAEQITSSLRATGMQVRAEFAEDGEDMDEMLANKNFDLVLFSLDLPEVSIAEAQQLIVASGKHVGLIALAQKVDASVIVEAINQGARDVLERSNTQHLIQVVKREASSIQLWRRAHRLELSFQESERRCQSLLSSSRDAVAYVHEGMHIYANQAYMKLFGNTDFDELEGTPIIDMVDASQQNQVKAFLRDLDEQRNETGQLELKMIRSNGENLSATVEFSPASYDGEPCNQVLIRSADEKAELEEKINYLHQHDLVSGLYNRQYFMRALKSAMGRAVKGDNQYAIVYFAIDNFQSIRDTVGISGCDVLISDVAIILTENADPDYTLARFGACSYASLGILKDKQLVEQFAAKILELVEQHISEIGKQSISVTCSAAIVFIDENSPDDPNSLVSRAEKTCKEVQQQGGNISKTYILKAGEMTQDEEDGITADLIKDALNQNRIKALYQPIVGIKGQDGERYQSSIQITVEDGRILGEAEYQSAADRTGTAKMLDRWKVLRAIKKISDSSKRGRAIEFLIPLSADSIKDSGLALWVSENLGKAKINGRQLVFMVNEAQVLSQLKAAKNLSKSLKQFKCQLAIDEFGAGLNPFQLAKHIDADYVRISHLFMNGLSQDSKNQESIREFARRASEMKLKTITPGVTDASILSVLWTLDVDFIQGDFLQIPQAELNYDFSSV
ncbi:MAG: EAL domain-containing protein [Gammaproteobacteria bacterium]|jgi:diguanylate cyclase (GGDEF)-like protein/PAS domain S-box-containing protein|nr:EAL domain-containing protein [Gammaproteobacteria bacterium]